MMYKIVNKCRLCGEITQSKSGYETESEAIASVKMPENAYAIHYCANGDIGNADFLGFKLVKGENDD